MRSDLWRVELLDSQDRTKRILQGVTGGSLEWSQFRPVCGSGSVQLTVLPGVKINWLTDRLKITHIDGETETPLGVWTLSMPGWETKGPLTTVDIKLADKSALLASPIGTWLSVPAGTVVTDRVSTIIWQHATGTAAKVMSSPLTLASPMLWEPEDTWLKVVNDLLATINYSALFADMSGRLCVEPYQPPARRAVVATYGPEREDLPMLPEWSDEADIFELPTGVRIVVSGDEEKPGFIGTADLPPEHPLSAKRRGQERLLVETSEAASKAVADEIAARRLQESLQVTRRISVTHPIDSTQLSDVVVHRPTGLRAAIVNRRITMKTGAIVEDSIRHIYSGGELPWA